MRGRSRREVIGCKVEAAAFSDDGRFASQIGFTILDQEGPNTFAVPMPTDGHFEDQHREPFVRLISLESGELLWQEPGHAESGRAVSFVPGRHDFVSGGTGGGAGECMSWGEKGCQRSFPQLDGNYVSSTAPLPDGKSFLAGCAWECALKHVDLASGRVHGSIEAHEKGWGNMLLSAAVSRDGRLAASGATDGLAKLWDLDSGSCLRTIEAGVEDCRVALSPDGTRLAAGGKTGAISLWDTQGRPLGRLEKGAQPVWFLAFSPDGSLLASTGYNGRFNVWSVESRTLRRSLKLLDFGLPTGLSFIADGAELLVGVGAEIERIDCGTGKWKRVFAPPPDDEDDE